MKTNVKKDERCLKVGVLGCGIICQAAHLIGCTKAHNIQLEAICDVAAELREKMAAIYSPKKVYDDYSKMLADPQIDAVIIGIGDQFQQEHIRGYPIHQLLSFVRRGQLPVVDPKTVRKNFS